MNVYRKCFAGRAVGYARRLSGGEHARALVNKLSGQG